MHKHPFLETRYRKFAILIITGLVVYLYATSLHIYSDMPWLTAFTDSFLTICILLIMGYYFWFIVDVIHTPQAELILSIGIMLVWLLACFLIQFIDYPVNGNSTNKESISNFLFLLPLKLCLGGLIWFLLVQWYRTVKLQRWKKERLLSESLQARQEENMDRIAVKSGSRIHVIPVKDLVHVQACGDYIMLYTPAGEFLKEQTMKSLESCLPDNFIRIHRSYIVNVDHIDRVELYGKETYHVQLKNGTALRASIAGYKLLKEKLTL